MQRWEYFTKTLSRNITKSSKWPDPSDWLNEYGKDGWELVSVHTRSESWVWPGISTEEVWVFKRPVN